MTLSAAAAMKQYEQYGEVWYVIVYIWEKKGGREGER